jgi:hypothetical protein
VADVVVEDSAAARLLVAAAVVVTRLLARVPTDWKWTNMMHQLATAFEAKDGNGWLCTVLQGAGLCASSLVAMLQMFRYKKGRF